MEGVDVAGSGREVGVVSGETGEIGEGDGGGPDARGGEAEEGGAEGRGAARTRRVQ